MTKYVLVSQGIKIHETFYKEEAVSMMDESNKEWSAYCEQCARDNEPCADNEVFMCEEEVPDTLSTTNEFSEGD